VFIELVLLLAFSDAIFVPELDNSSRKPLDYNLQIEITLSARSGISLLYDHIARVSSCTFTK
jgi:hypothetical protein